MAEELEKVGLYIDKFDKIRIIDPVVFAQTNDLKENYKTFDDNVKSLQQTMDSLITTLTNLGSNVDKEKMIAIGLRNSLKSVTKNRGSQQQKLQAMIMEKTMELERLQLEYHSLQLVEVEQQELIEYLNEIR